MKFNKREEKLIKLVEKENLSLSHQFDHLKRVAGICVELGEIYKGKRDVLVAAALTHDLGRSNPKWRGKKSAVKGAEFAKPVLKKAGYGESEIRDICRVISEHDQPDFHSDFLESRILKDADYLDGFGARGILRCIMYATETGGGVEAAIHRIGHKGRKRLEGLEFLESRRMGWKLHRLSEVFLSKLGEMVNLDDVSYEGKLISFEGISGCGKDTQAKLLKEYLEKMGKKVEIINHPSEFFKEEIWMKMREKTRYSLSEFYAIVSDRVRVIKEEMLPLLKKGVWVISSRTAVSTQSYQETKGYSSEFLRFCFLAEPVADLLVYLKVSTDEAWERTGKRVKRGTEKDRGFFGEKQERQKRNIEKILESYPNVCKVDAGGSEKEVFDLLKTCTEKQFSL